MKNSTILKCALPFFLLLFLIPQILVLPGCANIIPPTGGPRDSLPPILKSVHPPDSSKNFSAKKITFEFNEFVQLDNPQENLLVSPTPIITPSVVSKLRNVTVTLKDTLEPNTTYSINFGNAIKDVNEGNVLKNFTYVFSTGNTIDSFQLSGKVIIAETGKTDTTLIVLLHRNLDDSAVVKERPRYVTRLDREGKFNFRFLPAGTFALYAMKDEGGQKRYFSKSQLFAFADKPVTIGDSLTSITLYAFAEKSEEKTGQAISRPSGVKSNISQDKRLRFETNLQNGQLDLLSNLEFYFKPVPLKEFDSTKVKFVTEKFEPITDYRILRDTSNTKITLEYKWTENTAYHLIVDKDFAQDTTGRKLLKNDTLAFRTKKTSEYGLVRLRIPNLDLSKNPVLQFVQSDQVKFSYPLTSREFFAKLFLPGEYDLRILYDDNKNGKWDPGEFFQKHRQPEKVVPIPRKLTIKGNWDNEVDITL